MNKKRLLNNIVIFLYLYIGGIILDHWDDLYRIYLISWKYIWI